jgi:hypothetical protein
MKKLAFILFLGFFSNFLNAQEVMRVETNDGTISTFPVENVKRVFFDEASDKELIELSPSELSMFCNDEKKVSAQNVTEWYSENDFIATVNKNGVVKGCHVGSTMIVAKNDFSSAKCKVTIKPLYTLYDDPIFNWGASKEMIKSQETHNLFDEKETSLGYDYTFGSTVCLMGYNFEDRKLNSVMAIMEYTYSLKQKIMNYLKERYNLEGELDGYYYYIDANSRDETKTLVLFNTDYKTIAVMYSDFTSLNSNKARTRLGEDADVLSKAKYIFEKYMKGNRQMK